MAKYPENVELHTAHAVDVHAAHSSTQPQKAAVALTLHAVSQRPDRGRRAPNFSTEVIRDFSTSDTHQSHLKLTVTL